MTQRISGKTTICGIIGDPVEHTMSPAMHNAAFAETGLDWVYAAFHVKPDELKAAIEGMRALGIAGFNVTIPHKIHVIPLIDRLDPPAEKIGAVNTVVNRGGILTGYNTDASGFLRAMAERGIDPAGKNVVIIGAGGAARAVSFVLSESRANITIMNRASGMERAVTLAEAVAKSTGGNPGALELSEANLKQVLKKADILVNTTSVGMSPDCEQSPVPGEYLRPGLAVYDIVYNPVRTKLIREAEAVGAGTISGIDMLVWQGILAFELWTGVKPPAETMKREVMKLL